MNWLEATALGLVQGLTEFLPVSSSGHLVLAAELLEARDVGILFEVAVHLGTLVAVVAFYRRRIAEIAQGLLAGEADAWSYAGKLALATLPATVAAFSVRGFLEQLFEEPQVVGLALIITGLLLWTTRRTLPRARLAVPSWSAAFWIGCAQMLAMTPGISRSGATVAVALALGIAPLAAAEFSFLMSVAAIGGAALMQLPEAGAASVEVRTTLLVGGLVAALSGLAALTLFVRLLRTQHFHRFAYYVWAVAAVVLLWQNGA